MLSVFDLSGQYLMSRPLVDIPNPGPVYSSREIHRVESKTLVELPRGLDSYESNLYRSMILDAVVEIEETIDEILTWAANRVGELLRSTERNLPSQEELETIVRIPVVGKGSFKNVRPLDVITQLEISPGIELIFSIHGYRLVIDGKTATADSAALTFHRSVTEYLRATSDDRTGVLP